MTPARPVKPGSPVITASPVMEEAVHGASEGSNARGKTPQDDVNTPGGHLRPWERVALIVLLLSTWFLRWVALRDVPPGWRDDDLIELYTFSSEILQSGPVWYFTGASGHEPLYHTLRAPLIGVAGINAASARWMSATFGTLSVLLTWAVGRRMFTRGVGMLAALCSSMSFWSLMYSRVAIRHVGVLPWMLLAIYWGWRILQDRRRPRGAIAGIALGTAGSLLTYYAGRLIPPLLLVMLAFAGLPLNNEKFRKRWLPFLLGLGLGVLAAAPMFWTAANVPGGDARVGELAVPLTALMDGDPQPLLQTTWTTLGMAHARGDPEWLYNISERPVFGWLGALLLYLGILTRLGHLKQANARVVLAWLGAGIAPAFISLPPSSYGHTLLALPAVYILLSMPVKAAVRRWRWTGLPLAALTLFAVGARDLPDYFVTWPQDPLVRFLYRADYRAAAGYLDNHREITNVSMGSMLAGPWDKVAFETDIQRDDLHVRWFNPDRALVFDTSNTRVYLQDESHPTELIRKLMESDGVQSGPAGMNALALDQLDVFGGLQTMRNSQTYYVDIGGGSGLYVASVAISEVETDQIRIQILGVPKGPLPEEEEKLIPYPPPPGVYAGPPLKFFVHWISNGEFITGEDGIWFDSYALFGGEWILQEHRLSVPQDARDNAELHIGIYSPETGERWLWSTGEDRIVIPIQAVTP